MARVHGACDAQFSAVRELFQATLDAGLDIGASVAVYRDGAPVVDIWGGYADQDKTRPWQADTISEVRSVTKTMTALCILVLADRGGIDLDVPVARYWPEFATAGKDRITVAQVLGHTAGLPDWDQPLTLDELCDWEKATTLLARQAPRWEPGTAAGYHALTQGYLLGEIVRRVDGRSLGTFLAQEIAEPLGADFHIGLDPRHDHRVAEMIPAPPTTEPAATPSSSPVIPLRTRLTLDDTRTAQYRRAEIPAVSGIGNARAIAAIHSVLACEGDMPTRNLLSRKGCEAALREQAHGTDLVLGTSLRYGTGFGLRSPELGPSPLPHPRTCWWDGSGGSLVIIDIDAHLTIAYAPNHIRRREYTIGDRRGIDIINATYQALAT
ncbi:serine hydrolase domain-containing protein [Nocardia sp. NPDC051570]|uniref:serine hydrolase domain-containing protein n=1 Tax=Nocardia sp. NPDC051570 TaxID=3364324 RepID=UPI00379E1F92